MRVVCRSQEVQRDVADGGHVLGAMAGAEPAEVFVEDHIEDPVQAVLDVPVRADGAGKQHGIQRDGAEMEAPLDAGLAAALGLGLDHGGGLQTGKAAIGLQEGDVVADGMAAHLDATVIAVGGLASRAGWWWQGRRRRVRSRRADGASSVSRRAGRRRPDRRSSGRSWSGTPWHRWDRGRVSRPFGSALTDPGRRLSRTCVSAWKIDPLRRGIGVQN